MSLITSHLDCPTSLSDDQLAAFKEDGYLVFENALSPEEIAEARQGLSDIVRSFAFNEEVAEYKPRSSDSSSHSGATFRSKSSECFVQLEPGYDPDPNKLDELELAVRKTMSFENEAAIFKSICSSHPRIQGVVKSLLGLSVELYQSMALVKPPTGGVEKPWHQDNAYFAIEDMNKVLGTWIALDDATVSNGCMHVLKGGHLLGPLRHHHTFDCEIVPGRIDPASATPIELKAGGILIFHGNLPHQTPANSSPNRRRALQYHYRTSDNSIISKDEYFGIFKESDGTPASCSAAVPENF